MANTGSLHCAVGKTGDIVANVTTLREQLRRARYPVQSLDTQGLVAGRPNAVLPVLHFLFLDFSVSVAQLISEKGIELRAKSDLRFLEAAYRVLREHLYYSPALTTSQFFSSGFAERKVLLCLEVLRAVRRKDNELSGNSGGIGGAVRTKRCAAHGLDTEDEAAIMHEQFAGHLVEHLAQPQTPPRPFPPEPVQTPAKTAATDEMKDPTIAKISLRQLLEDIRSSLERRYDALEQRFEAHVEHVDARTTVLETELRIMMARMRSQGFDGAATARTNWETPLMPSSQLSETCGRRASEGAAAAGLPSVPVTAMAGNSWVACRTATNMVISPKPSLPLQDACNHDTSKGGACHKADLMPRFEPFAFEQIPQLAPQAQLPPQEQALVDKLTAQFRDTQLLLAKAQEQICQSSEGTKSGTERASVYDEPGNFVQEAWSTPSLRKQPESPVADLRKERGVHEPPVAAAWYVHDALDDARATSKTWSLEALHVNEPSAHLPIQSTIASDAALWAALHGTTRG